MKLIVPLLGALALVIASTPALAQGCCGGHEASPSSEEEVTESAAETQVAVHGGSIAKSGSYRLESVLRKDGLRIYVFDKDGRPLKVSKLTGKVTLSPAGADETSVDLKPVAVNTETGQAYLAAKLSLDFAAEEQQRISVKLSGLGETGADVTTYEVPFKQSPKVDYTCPMHAQVRSDDPGRCPKCEMKLVRREKTEKAEPARSQAYTCPMHPKVVATAPGLCPKCEMKLVKKSGDKASAPTKSAAYTCPMHPEVTSPTSGRCPKCGMALKKAGSSDPEEPSGGCGGCGG